MTGASAFPGTCGERVLAMSGAEVLVALAIAVGVVGVVVPVLPGLAARPRGDPGLGLVARQPSPRGSSSSWRPPSSPSAQS